MLLYLAAAILGLGAAGVLLRTFLKFRGVRVVSCPATGQFAAVDLAGWPIALTAVSGKPAVHIRDCSLWPERSHCDRTCAQEIEVNPSGTLLRSIMARWSQDKSCVCCRRPLAEMHVGPHQPCLLSPEGKIVEWHDIPPETLPEVLKTWGPVCGTCLLAETHTW